MKISKHHYYKQIFSFTEIDYLFSQNEIADARNGGLLLGPSHDDGGIYFLYEFNQEFKLFGEVEGFEYIIQGSISEEIQDFIEEINNYERDYEPLFRGIEYKSLISIIDARPTNKELYNAKYIIIESRSAIINKYSTKKFLEVINEKNSKENYS